MRLVLSARNAAGGIRARRRSRREGDALAVRRGEDAAALAFETANVAFEAPLAAATGPAGGERERRRGRGHDRSFRPFLA